MGDGVQSMGGIAAMGTFVLLYFAFMVAVLVVVLLSLWRGMRAQERMEQHLAVIADALSSRPQV